MNEMCRWTAAAVSLAISIATCPHAFAEKVGQMVPLDKRVAVQRIDHDPWNRLLGEYVDKRGLVDYRRWKRTAADQAALDRYLNQLSTAFFSSQTSKAVRLAFWVNAYNAVTIRGILNEYPTSSIRNHTAKLFGYNIWRDLKLPVDGKEYSLDDIEHNVLRPLADPRIHFTIVCASMSCPKLRREAYRPEAIEAQLNSAAREFFSDPLKFRVDRSTQTVWVSPILDWYGGDFGSTAAERLQRIAVWTPESAQPLLRSGEAKLKFLDYDWGLNDQAQ